VTSWDTDEVPERLGRYEVLVPIASGGMATVYLARSTGLAGFEREVALKLTHGHLLHNPEFVTALMDEARLAGRIRHPNVVSVHDVGEEGERVYIVMDYVEGDSLAGLQRKLMKRDSVVPLPVALRILDDVLLGLHAAHDLKDADGVSMGVVHRDVTPHNILLGVDGVSRLTDFGVAKAASRLTNTATGLVKGKIAYLAPEQARGQRIDRTCDVWAAGVVAWEMFSGMRLHEGLNDAALMLKIVREPPMRLSHLRSDLPRALDEAVAGALTLDPRRRHASAEVFADALTKAAASVGISRADARDVRDFILPMVQPELDTRKSKVTRLRQGRGSLPPTSERGLRIDQATVAVVPISRPPLHSSSSASHRRMDNTISEELEARDRTSATVFETSDRPPVVGTARTHITPRLTTRVLLYGGLAVLVGFFGFIAVLKWTATPDPSISNPEAPQPVTLPAQQPIAAPPISTEENADAEVFDPSQLPVDDPTPRPYTGGVRKTPKTGKTAPPPAETLPSKPEPLPSPYERK
jgi:serine/threonine protein kinase